MKPIDSTRLAILYDYTFNVTAERKGLSRLQCVEYQCVEPLDVLDWEILPDSENILFHGKTVIIVAHCLSNVKNADNKVVLNSGKITEQGTYLQLTTMRGKYYELVKNQLELGC